MNPNKMQKDWTVPRHNGVVTFWRDNRSYKVFFRAAWEPDTGIIQCDFEGDVPDGMLMIPELRIELEKKVDAILHQRARSAVRQNPRADENPIPADTMPGRPSNPAS